MEGRTGLLGVARGHGALTEVEKAGSLPMARQDAAFGSRWM